MIDTDDEGRFCQDCGFEPCSSCGHCSMCHESYEAVVKYVNDNTVIDQKQAIYVWDLLPDWVREPHPGLDPTMYGTGNYENDQRVHNKVRALLGLRNKQR